MYYILNETDQVVAADNDLLDICGVSHINELISSIIKNDTVLELLSDDSMQVKTEKNEETYTIVKTALSSMLGNLTLVSLSKESQAEDTLDSILDSEITIDDINDEISIPNNLLDDIEIEDTPLTTGLDKEDIPEKNDDISFGEHLTLDDDIIGLSSEVESNNTTEDKVPSIELEDTELFDLILDDEKPLEEVSTEVLDDTPLNLTFEDDDIFADTVNEEKDLSEILVDVEDISRKIGISTDDYKDFLNEFIDTSLSLEKDLRSTEINVRSEAVSTLSNMSDVLYLPELENIIDDISNAGNAEPRELIESFYSTLSRITTSSGEQNSIDDLEDTLEILDEPISQTTETVIEPETVIAEPSITSEKGFGTISLEGIKPKHFDFQLEEAANDLSLPVELIEEFVHDFIEQAHIETKKMLEAHENGDLDAIQKIGHLLKGASSNLRINALSDTLYKIQFCEDSSSLEALIKDYWAHFLSFEHQIDVISN